jgi:hypothetical protein
MASAILAGAGTPSLGGEVMLIGCLLSGKKLFFDHCVFLAQHDLKARSPAPH